MVIHDVGFFTDYDSYLFRQGEHFKVYEKLGARPMKYKGQEGVYFAVWAPNAEKVCVMGDFNYWNREDHPLGVRWDSTGIWEGFIPGIGKGCIYKYYITSRHSGYCVEKADPVGFHWETPPKTGSIVWDLEYRWKDSRWMKSRHKKNALDAPISIYEMHLGSWKRVPEDWNRTLSYREIADTLPEYLEYMGFTHVEFMPVMEYPFYRSWGYQALGYFAATSRHGTPQDLMYLIDKLHQRGIGVILDWVPSHFPSDDHGLAYFDGTHLYEHEDPRKGFHPEWTSCIFNYGRNEVKEFLISSALFWFDKYHIDGIRVDGVASMLYLDYARGHGNWVPNQFGGKENLDAIAFLKRCNEVIYTEHPDVQTIAEESTSWAMVSRPTYVGGLGFGMKWNMGWMHDTLEYFSKDPLYRKNHHNTLTFSMMYAFTENFVLPLSHDEVVHGKGALIGKMPGDEWQRFANLRLLYGYMYGHPGKKLLFMGGEFGQCREWVCEESLEWHVLDFSFHRGMLKWMQDLTHLYRNEPGLHEIDFSHEGFEWIDFFDWEQSIVSFVRKDHTMSPKILVVCNFTPVPRYNYRVGVPYAGYWKEILNSDATVYEGSGLGNFGGVNAEEIPAHWRPHSILLTLPPLSALFFKHE